MKSNLFLLPGIIFIFIACQGSESKFLSESQPVPAHPRILLLNGEEERIKTSIATDSIWGALHEVILKECRKMIDAPVVVYELEGRRLLEVSRECRKRLFYLSYAYRITGDTIFLQRAEKELLNVVSFKDWNPSHFLDVAEMMWAVSVSYDWLYDHLSESTRKKTEEAIIRLGIEPSFEKANNFWLDEDTNWNQVCNASLIFGALAIYEVNQELAHKVINRSIASVQLAMKGYEPDGTYAEGYQYWSYGTTFNAYLIDALEKAFNSDFGLLKNEGFLKTAGYLANIIGPSGMNFNYSDGPSQSMLNPVMFWFSNRLNDNSLLISEKILLAEKSDLPWQKDLPAIMIWGAKGKLVIKEPKELIWSGRGKNAVAMMRSSWQPDAIYVGLKAGSPDNNHGHMDVGSFVLDAMGERWAMDFGSQSYGPLESKGINIWSTSQESQRWQVFRYHNLAHNTLSFNNEQQLVSGNAPITQVTSDRFFLSATADLTSIYSNQVSKLLRGIAIINGQCVAIRDEIEWKDSTASGRWAMITPAVVTVTSKTTAELVQNNKKLILKIIEPQNVELIKWSTEPPHDYDEPNPGTTFVGFQFKGKPLEKVALTVLLIPDTAVDSAPQKISPLNEWKNNSERLK